MQCKKCKKECMANELTNGFCSECINTYNDNMQELNNIENSIAKYFKIWCIVTIIIGILLGIFSFFADNGIFISLLCIASSLVLAAFLRAIAEIIQLLEDIKNR